MSGEEMRALVVDDHADTAELLRRVLERGGVRATAVPSIRAAMAAAHAARFDLLISDIHLPDGDGCELLAALRRTGSIAAVALTGEDEAERCRKAGFDGFFAKPASVPRVVEAAIRIARSRRRAEEG